VTPRAVLVGLPGAGKTTTGRRLAKIIAVPFADSDDLVEARTGRSVREIFADDGEAAFRQAEAEAIHDALRGFEGVLALGGGALTTDSTRTEVVSCGVPVVLLLAPVGTLLARVGDAHTRPLLADAPEQRLVALAGERQPTYEQVATFSVETAKRTPGQVAAQIAARLHERAAQ
jgi:shikimate kinase